MRVRVNLVPRALFLALEAEREKVLTSASHMTTKHPEFVSVLNYRMIAYDKQNIEDGG